MPFFTIFLVNLIKVENLPFQLSPCAIDAAESDKQKLFFSQTVLHGIFYTIPWQLKKKKNHLSYLSSRTSESVKLGNISEAKSGLTVACGTI